MPTAYFGILKFELWEIICLPIMVLVVLSFAFFIKKKNEKLGSEYSYFLPGLIIKIISGLIFGFIYMYYYKGGDTMMYYQCTLAFANLFYDQPIETIRVLLEPASKENLSAFNLDTGYPLWYLYVDIHSFSVIRFTTPLIILCFKSYLLATVLLSTLSYFGIWKVYRLFCSYYPKLKYQMAIAFLFFPSIIFWGSGILKDTYTFSATCLFVFAFHNLFIKPKGLLINVIYLIIAFNILIYIKPYIIIVLLPGAVLWMLNDRLRRIKNKTLAFITGPLAYTLSLVLILSMFLLFGDALGDYSFDNIFEKAAITQNDLKKEYYGTNSFDIGSFDATPFGVIKKAPIAILSGLYRPFIWEASSPFILLSAIEGAIMFLLSIWVIVFYGPINVIRELYRNPIITFCISFSVLYAFSIGLTTPNFGALVRFKITCLPFYVVAWYILKYEIQLNRAKAKSSNYILPYLKSIE